MTTETLQGTEVQRANRWIATGRVGISSKTIWAVMMHVIPSDANASCHDYGVTGFDIPYDADDFSRCHALLQQVPEWRARMPEMGKAFPKWQPIARMWEDLTTLYEAKAYSELYRRLRVVRDECMILDGWVKDRHAWTRKTQKTQPVDVPVS